MSHVGAGSSMQCFAGDTLTIFKISSAIAGRKPDRAGNCLGSITGGLALDVDRRILLTLFLKKSADSYGENLQSNVALGWLRSTPIFDQSAAGSFMFKDNAPDQYSVYCSRRYYRDWERQALNDSSRAGPGRADTLTNYNGPGRAEHQNGPENSGPSNN